MNSNGASPGASTIFYRIGSASGTGEELAAVLQANSAPIPLPPTAPMDVKVVYARPNPGGFLVSWTASSSYVLPTYTIVASPGDITKTSSFDTFVKFNVATDGIVLGTTYTFVVTAMNSVGTSPPSASSAPLKAITFPDPPTGVDATAEEDKKSTVSWTPPTYDGDSPILAYTAYSLSAQDPVVHSAAVDGATSSSVVVTGLTNGFKYRFYVSATNLFGEGQQSSYSPIIIPRGPPSPPLNVVAVPLNSAVSITWDVPVSNGGLPISSYTVTSNPGNIIVLSVQIPTLFQNLINGTEYTFTVYATNLIGDSLSSIPSLPVIPATFPSYPLNPTAVAGNGEAQVSWDAPSSDGGSPIINYTVITDPATVSGAQTTPDDSTTLLVTGLTNGTSYTFTVYATNIMGNSFISTSTQPVTPS